MSDSPGPNPNTPDPAVVAQLVKELEGLDMRLWDRRLEDVHPAVADAVRMQLYSQAGTAAEATQPTALDPSEADTIAPGFKSDPPPEFDDESRSSPLPAHHRRLVGRTLGPYSVRRLIGSGAMGQVWEAIQEQPQRSVALKVLRAAIISPAARERFQFEVEVLGRLKHPGIAQIYDAGTFEFDGDKIPYFAMEYIARAQPLDEYARRAKLDLEGRLQLFTKVCEAVAHGHQRGIIHRDLKPANILVDTEGRPKVIDFGVARATDSDTRATIARTNVGQIIGTLQYMSPEQCSADPTDIDVRADVYSLGVILYELVAEKLPYDLRRAAVAEAIRVIQDELPPRLSTFDRTIAADVEVIANKALEKEPARRYRSAGDLADDVRRFLDDEPITAKPPSVSEVLRRYARKNKAMATAISGIAIAFILGVIGVIIFAVEAERAREETAKANVALTESLARETEARDLAEERFQNVRSLANEVLGPIAFEVKNLAGSTAARKMMVETGRRYLSDLEAHSKGNRLLRYDIALGHENLGDLLGGRQTSNLGDPDGALEQHKIAAGIMREQDRRGDLSRILQKQAEILLASDSEQAGQLLEEAMGYALEALKEQDGDRTSTVRLYSTLFRTGELLTNDNKTAQGLLYHQRAYDLILALLEDAPQDAVLQRNAALSERFLAYSHDLRGNLEDSRRFSERSLSRFRAINETQPDSARRKWDLSWSCYSFGAFLLVHHSEEELGPVLVLESVELMTIACVASPAEATYRNDLARLVPIAHENLVDAGHRERADRALHTTILALQPVTEAMPENLALIEVHQQLLQLRRGTPLP